MLRKLLKTPARIMLIVYGVAAFSPVFAQFPSLDDARVFSDAPRTARVGILWVDVLFESLTGDGQNSDHAGGERFLRSSQDDKELVIIRRKRAVLQRSFRVRPQQTIAIAAGETAPPLSISFSSDIPRNPVHRHADGYYSLSAGLSPPLPTQS